MQYLKPGFRRDLVAESGGEGSADYVVVRDLKSQRTLRFTTQGYAVARQLNGERSLEEVALAIHRELGLPMSVEKLGRLVTRLDALGCLSARSSQVASDCACENAVTRVQTPKLFRVAPKQRGMQWSSWSQAEAFLSMSTAFPTRQEGGGLGAEPSASLGDFSSRLVFLAGFTLVTAALWATWAVLRVL